MLPKGPSPFRYLYLYLFTWSLLILYGARTALAQEIAPYCTNITESECKLVANSVVAMSEISSGRAEMSFDILLQEIPGLTTDELSLQYDHTIEFDLGADFATRFHQVQRMSQTQLISLVNEPVALLQLARITADDLQLSADLAIEMSEGMAALLADEVSPGLKMAIPASLSLRLVLVDGTLYIHTASIEPFASDFGSMTSGWIGIGTVPLIELVATQLQLEPSSTALETFGSAAVTGLSLTGAGIATIEALDPTGEAVKILTLEVLKVDEASTRETVVRTTADYPAFFNSPLYEQLIYFLAAQQGHSLNQDEVEEFLLIGTIMGPPLLSGLDVALTETIQNESGYVTDGDFALTWNLKDLLTLASQSDPTIQLTAEMSPSVEVNVSTTMSGLNQASVIAAPTDVLLLPEEIVAGFLE